MQHATTTIVVEISEPEPGTYLAKATRDDGKVALVQQREHLRGQCLRAGAPDGHPGVRGLLMTTHGPSTEQLAAMHAGQHDVWGARRKSC